MRGLLVLAVVVVTALWLVSHAAPTRFGTCHHVPLNIGNKPSVRECEAYGTDAFVVPLAVIGILALILGGEGDIEIDMPLLGKFKRTRAGKAAANVLKDETNTLDERGLAFLQTVEPTSSQGNVDDSPSSESSQD